eukprot:355106-Chlamydomonas_euryale.AAC.4
MATGMPGLGDSTVLPASPSWDKEVWTRACCVSGGQGFACRISLCASNTLCRPEAKARPQSPGSKCYSKKLHAFLNPAVSAIADVAAAAALAFTCVQARPLRHCPLTLYSVLFACVQARPLRRRPLTLYSVHFALAFPNAITSTSSAAKSQPLQRAPLARPGPGSTALPCPTLLQWPPHTQTYTPGDMSAYESAFKWSWAADELRASRNVRPGFRAGLLPGVANAALESVVGLLGKTWGKTPWTLSLGCGFRGDVDASRRKEEGGGGGGRQQVWAVCEDAVP